MLQTTANNTNNLTFASINAEFLKNNLLINSLVHANIYISLAAVVVSYFANIVLGKPQNLFLNIASFSVMFLIYTVNRFSDIKEDEINSPNRVLFIKQYGKAFLFSSFALFLGSIIFALFTQPLTAIFIAFPILIGILYSFAGLKKFFLVKNLTVGLGWACLPLINASFYETYSVSIICFTIFVGVCWLINSTIFDIKDIEGDRLQNVKTLPVRIGLTNTKRFCSILNLGLVFFVGILLIINILPLYFAVFFFINAYIFVYIFSAKAKNNPLFYGIFIDGEFIATAIIFSVLFNIF